MDFNMISTLRRLRESIATLKYSCFRAKCDKNLHENHLIHPSARLLQRSPRDAKKDVTQRARNCLSLPCDAAEDFVVWLRSGHPGGPHSSCSHRSEERRVGKECRSR